MGDYLVIREGTYREVITVTAESEDEARENWLHGDQVVLEVIDGETVEVRLDD